MSSRKHVAVVLFQLGGPDSLEAVEPFLFNLFMDPDIIDFPFARMARRPLAKFISTRRGKKVAEHYKEIGGRSPILELTDAQAVALRRALDGKVDAEVFVAMRYWHPLTDVAAQKVKEGNFDEIVLLPLYPQYSITTSGSSLNEWNRQCARFDLVGVPQKIIHYFYDSPLYLDALTDNINAALGRFPPEHRENVHLVFSAHGVPVSIIERGDPYQRHIEETVRLVRERGGWTNLHTLCYQSKVGPAKWLKPSLDRTIHALATGGIKQVLVIPVAFVTEHIETLHEIGIETREQALKLGIERFETMPALNDHPKFIQSLAQEVLKRVEGREE